ncbi:MAG: DUF362 domain-containing protein [Armatimonadetes bacterium]|nr:DUF362 domain-containing protein [Armatimonadota bacterium]
MKPYTVRAARCDHRASDETIYESLKRITEPLTRSWEKIRAARKVVIKTNMVWLPERVRHFAGRRQEHVDDSVFRASLRLLRENTSAQLVVADSTFHPRPEGVGRDVYFKPLLDELGVEYVEANDPPHEIYEVPGGGLMFSRYLLPACFKEADAVVSIAKLKNHAFMGVTLCLKNLFGLSPMHPAGRPRNYYHHILRMPYFLPDLGLIMQPCLNIIDALVGQARREWGGEARVCDALIAGDHVIATDACATHLMGHDPMADWPASPFYRDRNPLLVAAEHGFGAVEMNQIDFASELEPPLAEFDADQPDTPETVSNWRRTTCEQALHYLEHEQEIVGRYRGEYVFLQEREVVWHGGTPEHLGSRRALSGVRPDSALWLKYVDPDEREGEHYEVYEQNLQLFQEGRFPS